MYFQKFSILITILSLGFELISSEVQDNYCYADDKDPYLYTSTKTPYHFVHGLIQNSTVPNCEPMQIWMLSRHGTRFPSKNQIEAMLEKLPDMQHRVVENHEKRGSGSLCKKDLENLKSWKVDPNLNIKKARYLAQQGEEDLSSLGKRFKTDFPDLLVSKPSDVPSKTYFFKSTNTQRTITSMNSFINGLSLDDSATIVKIISLPTDSLMKSGDSCEPWVKAKSNSSLHDEVKDFLNGTEYKQLIRDVSRRLGFPNNLTLENITLMHTACAFEKAWSVNKLSPWCAAFTKDEMRVFEYEDDLYRYYDTGYGQKESIKMGCPMVKDMFERFSSLAEGEKGRRLQGMFYFSHSSAIQTFYTAMGIAKDTTPLKASNYKSMKDRKWRTSLLGPFAANFVAVFYKCNSSSKVRLYLNEKPLMFEGCQMGVCDWEQLKKKLGPVALNCDTHYCDN